MGENELIMHMRIRVGEREVKQVGTFTYLRTEISDGGV